MTTPTSTLIKALRILARDIQSDDGVANAAIAEAAERLEEQHERIGQLEAAGDSMEPWCKNDLSCINWRKARSPQKTPLTSSPVYNTFTSPMDDPILIAKLASKIQIPRDGSDLMLGFHDDYVAKLTGVEKPFKAGDETDKNFHQMLHWTIKAEAALRVMLAREILNAAHK